MLELWEILVPCTSNSGKPFRTRCHKEWDRRIRKITGGLTIFPPVKGQWVAPSGEIFSERMICVRVATTAKFMQKIADITAVFYQQEAVMYYKVSDTVIIKEYPEFKAE